VLHSTCTHRDRVNPRLFVVGSQIVSLTPSPSFNYNLCCICPNGSCEAIFNIYTSRPFQLYKEHLKARCFAFYCRALKLRESRRTPNSHFWECESHPHPCLKVGLRQFESYGMLGNHVFCKMFANHCRKKYMNNSSTLCYANVQSFCSSNANLWMFSLEPISLAISLVCVNSTTFIFNCTRFIDRLHSLISKIHVIIMTS